MGILCATILFKWNGNSIYHVFPNYALEITKIMIETVHVVFISIDNIIEAMLFRNIAS